jgi:8-hydroxy-5-deazaflavin:NADPH oxidoreductase
VQVPSFRTKMPLVGLIGGTGDLGYALGVHLSKKQEVLLGSRKIERAKAAVEEILAEKNVELLKRNLRPAENHEAAQSCDVLILTVPHANALETVASLSGDFRGNQVLVSAVAAIAKRGDEFVVEGDPSGESFAQKIRQVLPSSVKVAVAFQTVPANILYREKEISADVPVAAESPEVYETVALLISGIAGLRPLYLGSLQLASEIERLTAFLLNVGKRNGLKSPTIKFPSF